MVGMFYHLGVDWGGLLSLLKNTQATFRLGGSSGRRRGSPLLARPLRWFVRCLTHVATDGS